MIESVIQMAATAVGGVVLIGAGGGLALWAGYMAHQALSGGQPIEHQHMGDGVIPKPAKRERKAPGQLELVTDRPVNPAA